MEDRLKIYGIRHHGAGSARRISTSLKKFQPNVICIEIPYEANELLSRFELTSQICPLAIMFYSPNNPSQCLYYPFAEFSPEYQALRYGIENGIEIKAIDLPAGISLISNNFNQELDKSLTRDQKNIIRDPISYLARKSGYKDTELWWNSYFESWTEGEDLFDTVNQLMQQLRNNSAGLDDDETLTRESFMHSQLQLQLKESDKKIAVVCGAWHAPVLVNQNFVQQESFDSSKYKSIPIQTSIIPWNYSRLVLNSDYSAGIESPSWSECLFTDPNHAVSRWFARAAKIFRLHDISVSTAELIDSERLARELALIREIPVPGIVELFESCLTVLGKNEELRIKLIKEEIIIGSRFGQVDLKMNTLALVKEFKNCITTLSLKPYWSQNNKEFKELDLRKEKHLLTSQFLHKSCLLGLNWCSVSNDEKIRLGNFSETWTFQWTEELEIELSHKATYGSTIEEVIIHFIDNDLKKNHDLLELAQKLEHLLKSNLQASWIKVLEGIRLRTFDNTDVEQLSYLINPLVACLNYGSLYKINMDQVKGIIQFILPKIILDFKNQLIGIGDEKAKRLIESYNLINRYFIQSRNDLYLDLWKDECKNIGKNKLVHPIARGYFWNKLLENKTVDEEDFAIEIKYQFKDQLQIEQTAKWIEGFLYQSNAFYLINETSLSVMNEWLIALQEDEFKNILPLLRRSFSTLGQAEINSIRTKIYKNKEDLISPTNITLIVNKTRLGYLSDLFKLLE